MCQVSSVFLLCELNVPAGILHVNIFLPKMNWPHRHKILEYYQYNSKHKYLRIAELKIFSDSLESILRVKYVQAEKILTSPILGLKIFELRTLLRIHKSLMTVGLGH
jgi:hypothetical protein